MIGQRLSIDVHKTPSQINATAFAVAKDADFDCDGIRFRYLNYRFGLYAPSVTIVPFRY